MDDFFSNLIAAGAYSAAGLVAMALAFLALDWLTPGPLRAQVWQDRNRNAATLVASNLAGVAIIVVAAIVASTGGLAEGLIYTAAYTFVGLVVMAAAFALVHFVTPGNLGDAIMDSEPHPAVRVHAVLHIAIAAIVAASIL